VADAIPPEATSQEPLEQALDRQGLSMELRAAVMACLSGGQSRRSREIYKAIAADAAACGVTPKQFAERFMEQAIRELRKLSLDI
jgi:hypothetical protein